MYHSVVNPVQDINIPSGRLFPAIKCPCPNVSEHTRWRPVASLAKNGWGRSEGGTTLMKWKIPLTSSGLDSRQWDSRKQNEMAWIVSFKEGNLPTALTQKLKKPYTNWAPGSDLYLVARNVLPTIPGCCMTKSAFLFLAPSQAQWFIILAQLLGTQFLTGPRTTNFPLAERSAALRKEGNGRVRNTI